MERYLVTIEFRYSDAPDSKRDYTSRDKTITIGTYDEFEVACAYGNRVLETLESRFKLHRFPDGRDAKKDRFSINGGCFGGKNNLVTNLAYLNTPFAFYAKITTQNYVDVNETIDEVLASVKRYRKYLTKRNQE